MTKILVDEFPYYPSDCPFIDPYYRTCKLAFEADCRVFNYNEYTDRVEADPDKCDYLMEAKNEQA